MTMTSITAKPACALAQPRMRPPNRLPVVIDRRRIEDLREGVGQIWQAIRSGNFYPSPSPMNCTNCPFKSKCSVFAKT